MPVRLNLPELEDSPRCPRWIRDAMTAYLQTVIEAMRPYAVTLPVIEELLAGTEEPRVIDLASGAGGPWPGLLPDLRRRFPDATVELTDAYPNLRAARRFESTEGMRYVTEPRSLPGAVAGAADLHTCFTALHHFDPGEVESILRFAQQSGVPFLAAEATHRSLRGLVAALFIPLLVLGFMPRVRPRRVLPLLLTYFPPVLTLMIWWDGFASTLKSYSQRELEKMVREIEVPGYEWRVAELTVPRSPIPILCISGRPSAQSERFAVRGPE